MNRLSCTLYNEQNPLPPNILHQKLHRRDTRSYTLLHRTQRVNSGDISELVSEQQANGDAMIKSQEPAEASNQCHRIDITDKMNPQRQWFSSSIIVISYRYPSRYALPQQTHTERRTPILPYQSTLGANGIGLRWAICAQTLAAYSYSDNCLVQ